MSIQKIGGGTGGVTPTFLTIGTIYLAANIDAAAVIVSQSGTVNATGATISGGSGVNQGAGNRYTLTFPAHPEGTAYHVAITADGILTSNPLGHAMIPHVISKTATSVTYALNSGEPGQNAHNFKAFAHDIIITGKQQLVINVI